MVNTKLLEACEAVERLANELIAGSKATTHGATRAAVAVMFREKVTAALKAAREGECDACGFPNNPDGSCSRSQCCNAD